MTVFDILLLLVLFFFLLTVNTELPGVLQSSVFDLSVLGSTSQNLPVVLMSRLQGQDGLGDVADLAAGELVRVADEGVPEPPGHHGVRPGPGRLALHQVGLAHGERLLQGDDADVHRGEDHLDLEVAAERAGQVVVC